jgi:hypothetical protein
MAKGKHEVWQQTFETDSARNLPAAVGGDDIDEANIWLSTVYTQLIRHSRKVSVCGEERTTCERATDIQR